MTAAHRSASTRPSSRGAFRAALALVCVLPLGSAHAQIGDFSWEQVGEPSAFITIDEDSIHIIGPDNWQCVAGGVAAVETTAPVAGYVFADYLFDNQDTGFGWWAAEDPIYTVGGAVSYVGPYDFYEPWQGLVYFHVAAGQSFGFGVASIDCGWGPGVLDVTGFHFVPDLWTNLGGALTGTAGNPKLTGIGPLFAESPYTISLVDALPNTTAWMVLSSATLGAPFKGGVMVPDPSPPALVAPLPTGLGGRIILSDTWPAGIPAGVPLVIQYWIVDPAGPAGFSASNGVTRITG